MVVFPNFVKISPKLSNRYFDKWYEHIEWNLRARLAKDGASYNYEEDCNLFEEHRKLAFSDKNKGPLFDN